MVPAPFRSLRALRVLNVAGVGLALAAFVSAVFAGMLDGSMRITLSTGLPTCVLGMVWASLLRWPKTVGRSSFRWGWAASVPLAALNAALASGALWSLDRGGDPEHFLVGAALGATIGAMFWIPWLLVTLLCFGAPIAHGQRLAGKGLAGEERGEWVVGLACFVMSLLGLVVTGLTRPSHDSGLVVPCVLALAGLSTAGLSTLLAFAREGRRRRFVADAEAGKVAGYRVDPTDEGKVLVRVVSQGEGYRVADFEQEIFELGAEGEATRARVMEMEVPRRP